MANLEQRLRSVGQAALARDAATLTAQFQESESKANYWFLKARELLVENEELQQDVARLHRELAAK